jgi:bifunctional non-homologous end joining protein LigD
MARRDGVSVRLLTRNGHDWGTRFPLIVQAVSALKVRSCLLEGEPMAYDAGGLASF